MCDVCIMNAVRDKMLSRRSFFKTAAGAGAMASVGMAATGTPAMAAGHGSVVDMTHSYDAEFPTYFGAPGISDEQKFNFAENGFNLKVLTINEHTGSLALYLAINEFVSSIDAQEFCSDEVVVVSSHKDLRRLFGQDAAGFDRQVRCLPR